MNFWFAGDYTSEQAQGAIRAKEALMLDLDGWPITIELLFTEDPDPTQPDEFAVTNQIAFDHYTIAFRNDAPHFHNGPSAMHFDIVRFYQETVAHEMGHVLSFSLNDTGRDLLSRLFNCENTTEAWFPAAAQWADRPGEAIAETFKDAFLPIEFREYDNRTNITLNYPFYPLFRAIFRNALTNDMLRDAEDVLGIAPGELGEASSIGIGSDTAQNDMLESFQDYNVTTWETDDYNYEAGVSGVSGTLPGGTTVTFEWSPVADLFWRDGTRGEFLSMLVNVFAYDAETNDELGFLSISLDYYRDQFGDLGWTDDSGVALQTNDPNTLTVTPDPPVPFEPDGPDWQVPRSRNVDWEPPMAIVINWIPSTDRPFILETGSPFFTTWLGPYIDDTAATPEDTLALVFANLPHLTYGGSADITSSQPDSGLVIPTGAEGGNLRIESPVHG